MIVLLVTLVTGFQTFEILKYICIDSYLLCLCWMLSRNVGIQFVNSPSHHVSYETPIGTKFLIHRKSCSFVQAVLHKTVDN